MEPKHNPLEIARKNLELTQQEIVKVKITISFLRPTFNKILELPVLDKDAQDRFGYLLSRIDDLEERNAGLLMAQELDSFEFTTIVQTTYRTLQELLAWLNTAQGDLGGGLSEETSRETQEQIESITREIEETVILMKKYGVAIPED